MANYLDADLELIVPDPDTGELKVTPYFENYLYEIIASLGGEGSTVIGDLIAVTFESDKFPYYSGLVKALSKQVEEIQHTINSPILDAKVKSMQARLNELEACFNIHRLEGVVRQLEVDTSGFIGDVKVTNYTARNKDWIEARNKAVITLPANPLVNDQVIVSNGDGSEITIKGNGNNIKYKGTDTSIKTRSDGTSLHFQLFRHQVYGVDERYWRVR